MNRSLPWLRKRLLLPNTRKLPHRLTFVLPQPIMIDMANILIVDDDVINSQLLVNKLTSNGHSVVHATDGEAARANISHKYDLVLLDIMMPKVDGITLLSELKKGVNKNTPILIFTNLFVEETKKKCMEMGATDVLLKADFTPQTIVEKIETYLAKS